jgi:hypothetical protein
MRPRTVLLLHVLFLIPQTLDVFGKPYDIRGLLLLIVRTSKEFSTQFPYSEPMGIFLSVSSVQIHERESPFNVLLPSNTFTEQSSQYTGKLLPINFPFRAETSHCSILAISVKDK